PVGPAWELVARDRGPPPDTQPAPPPQQHERWNVAWRLLRSGLTCLEWNASGKANRGPTRCDSIRPLGEALPSCPALSADEHALCDPDQDPVLSVHIRHIFEMSQMVWNSNHSEIITVASTGLDMAILGLHANASIFAKCLIDWHCLCLLAFRYPLASYGSCSFKIFSFDVPVLSFTAGRHRADPATTVRTKETTMSAALTTWRPIFGTIEPFRREMEDLMGRFFAEEERNGQLAKTWSPRLD